jgi:hypothetical protein
VSRGIIPIEVYDERDEDGAGPPLFVAKLPAVPRVGEHLAKAIDGYFDIFEVKKVWYRQDWDFPEGPWFVCILVGPEA